MRAFQLEVLADNKAMVKLADGLFPDARFEHRSGVLLITAPLPTEAVDTPPERPQGVLYRVFSLAAMGAVEVLQRVLHVGNWLTVPPLDDIALGDANISPEEEA